MDNKIFVTQPYMPPLEEYVEYLEKIWESKWITNDGQFHEQLENELCNHLGVKHISLFTNGTLALITAIQAMRLSGEVITTPFSFPATTHALWWNNIKPVFVDVEPEYLNIDSSKIEAAITPNTTAIMPVHVYGNPCNVKEIERIADTYGLKVIYDAAHAFDVKINGDSVLNMGDFSVLSFHATKVFSTIEGGAIISPDEKTKKRIDYLKNFGIVDEVTVIAPGINAKMNEFQASFGLLQLKYFPQLKEKRKNITKAYRTNLSSIKGISCFKEQSNVSHNYAYFPILIDKQKYGISRDELYTKLKEYNVFSRKYFYPLISELPSYKGLSSAKPENLPVANKYAQKVLCIPIYPELTIEKVEKICSYISNLGQ